MGDKDYLCQLNEPQRVAVEYLDGPELVIAGAGSGKTRVLTYKILHLLNSGVSPYRIMALTFTNKAAREMRERIGRIAGEEIASKLWMGTFHSIFSRMLRRHAECLGFRSDFTIYDSADSKNLIKLIIKDMQLGDNYTPGLVQNEISNAKNNLYSPEDYAADRDIMHANAESKRPRLADIYSTYCNRCKISGAMDFDDLLFYTNVLLRDNQDILNYYREYFSYVLVDEYQDTNFAQHLIVRQLCSVHGRLCVVGDDAQSIYSFRGANIRNILDLRKSFPTLKIFKLEQNYRSTGTIVGAANSLIACNKEQIPKEVFSRNGTGERIELVKSFNEYEEAYSVAHRIPRLLVSNKNGYDDIAILYRTNAQSRVLEEALRNRNIPYRIYGGLSFYQRKEIKDAISYFRLAVNPNDDEALRRVINTPKRGIGDTTIGKLTQAAIASGRSIFAVLSDTDILESFNKGTRSKLLGFHSLINDFIKQNAEEVMAPEIARNIYDKTGILREYINAGNTPENISKRDNLLELINAIDINAESFKEQNGDGIYSMSDFLSEISLLTDADIQSGSENSVTLMTIHSAKGLEFDSVFIVGVEEDLLPSAMSLHSPNAFREVEEERRLMYVAMTRAKRFCMISYASKRLVNGKTIMRNPSRFIAEINADYLKPIGVTINKNGGASRTSAYASSLWNVNTIPQNKISRERNASLNPPVQHKTAVISGRNEQANDCRLFSVSELNIGQKIFHPRFGSGELIAIDMSGTDHRITVKFDDDKSTRTLLLKFAKFKLL